MHTTKHAWFEILLCDWASTFAEFCRISEQPPQWTSSHESDECHPVEAVLVWPILTVHITYCSSSLSSVQQRSESHKTDAIIESTRRCTQLHITGFSSQMRLMSPTGPRIRRSCPNVLPFFVIIYVHIKATWLLQTTNRESYLISVLLTRRAINFHWSDPTY